MRRSFARRPRLPRFSAPFSATATSPCSSIRSARRRQAPPSSGRSSTASPKPISQQLPASALGSDSGGTAADVVQRMRDLYCGTLAYEFEHLNEEAEREWFRKTIESGEATAPLTADEKRRCSSG